MSTNYDELAGIYPESKQNPIKLYSEEFTFWRVLGPVAGQTVLDVACGDGYYSRRLKQLGAAQVVGVDISEGMVAQARAIEQTERLGVIYKVRDIAQLDLIGAFDLAIAVYLFPYAPSRPALQAMARAIAANLKPGGRLLAVTTNPDVSQTNLADLRKYGTALELAEPLVDGAPVIATLFTEAGEIRLSTRYWSQATYEQVLAEAGFCDVCFHRMAVSAKGLQTFGPDYWATYLANPIITLIEGRKINPLPPSDAPKKRSTPRTQLTPKPTLRRW